MVRGGEELRGERVNRQRRDGVDDPGAQTGERVRQLEGDRLIAGVAHQVDLVGASRRDVDPQATEIVGSQGRLGGEKPNPTRITPEQDVESPIAESRLEIRRDSRADVINFFERPKHHRHQLEGVDGGIDLAESSRRQESGVDLTDPHLLHVRRLAAQDPAGIDGHPETSVGAGPQGVTHAQQALMKRRAVRRQGAEFDPLSTERTGPCQRSDQQYG